MSPIDADPRECAIADALQLIGERWALLIVREMFWGVHRFSDIARNTGAPRDVLTARLRTLVAAGVLERRQYSDKPARYEYRLTASGRALSPVLLAIQEWSYANTPGANERPSFPHHQHQLRPSSSWRCEECGEELRVPGA